MSIFLVELYVYFMDLLSWKGFDSKEAQYFCYVLKFDMNRIIVKMFFDTPIINQKAENLSIEI